MFACDSAWAQWEIGRIVSMASSIQHRYMFLNLLAAYIFHGVIAFVLLVTNYTTIIQSCARTTFHGNVIT